MSGWPWYHHVFNLIIWFCWMMPYCFLLPKKFPLRRTLLYGAIGFLLYYLTVMCLTHAYSIVRFLVGEAVMILVPLLLFDGKLREKLLIWMMIVLIELLADLAAYAITALAPVGEETTLVSIWGYVLSLALNLVLLSLLIVAGLSLKRRSEYELQFSQTLLFLLFPISQALLLVYLMTVLWREMDRTLAAQTVFVTLLCVASDFLLFQLLRSAASASSDAAKVRLLEEECARQDRCYAALADDYEKAVSMRAALNEARERFACLVAEERREDALRCADALSETHLADVLPQCQNRVVASFLSHRMEEACEHGVRMTCTVEMPADIGIPDPELICLFGNLLDNAAEACANVPDAEIALQVEYRAPYLCVRMDNTDRNDDRPRKKHISELERGLGFRILNQLADTYDGEFRAEKQGERFCTSVMLKGGEDHAAYRRM